MKTVWRKPHGFESHPLRHTCGGQFACRSFFIYISLDNIDFATKNTPAVRNSPAAVFLFISHSTILISQQKTHLRWAIRLPQFFIYISLDNIDFATKNTPAVGNRISQFIHRLRIKHDKKQESSAERLHRTSRAFLPFIQKKRS